MFKTQKFKYVRLVLFKYPSYQLGTTQKWIEESNDGKGPALWFHSKAKQGHKWGALVYTQTQLKT